jgi:hypothetical protein
VTQIHDDPVKCAGCDGEGCPYCGGPERDYHTMCFDCVDCAGTGVVEPWSVVASHEDHHDYVLGEFPTKAEAVEAAEHEGEPFYAKPSREVC